MTRADSAADSPMADHVDNDLYPMDLGDDWHMPYRVLVYGGDGGKHADIVWREELRFHHELADSDAAGGPAYGPHCDELEPCSIRPGSDIFAPTATDGVADGWVDSWAVNQYAERWA